MLERREGFKSGIRGDDSVTLRCVALRGVWGWRQKALLFVCLYDGSSMHVGGNRPWRFAYWELLA